MNPILANLNRNKPAAQNANGLLGRLAEVRQIMNGQPPQVLYERMLQSNPAFAQFVRQNAGKDPRQLAREYGIDPALIETLLR